MAEFRPTRAVASIECVGPKEASEFLKKNLRNRPLTKSVVTTYAINIEAGNWPFTGTAHIIVGWDGVLLNGQHTCSAIVKAGKPIWTVVVRDVDPESFVYLDAGSKRTAGQVISIAGLGYGNTIAAAARLVWKYDNDRLADSASAARAGIASSHLLDIATKDAERWQALASIAKTGSRLTRPSTTAAFLHLACRDEDHAVEAVAFVRQVIDGIGLELDSPALAARRWFERRNTADAEETLSVWVYSWNAHVAGQQRKIVKQWIRGGTPFPRLVTDPKP
jgi:hypothetical protein